MDGQELPRLPRYSPLVLEPLDKILTDEKTYLFSSYDDGIQRIGCSDTPFKGVSDHFFW